VVGGGQNSRAKALVTCQNGGKKGIEREEGRGVGVAAPEERENGNGTQKETEVTDVGQGPGEKLKGWRITDEC